MSHLWQHPFVNVFKHIDVGTWKRSTKEGEVATMMDKILKGTVYKITGSIPAGNYIQLPKTTSQSLGLTGRYLYLMFKPIPSKYFVVHIDVATQDGLIVRISFSNLFKEFKSTSTWLQFPFICNPAGGSVSGFASEGSKESSGPAPFHTRWTVLCLDFQNILSVYLSRKYSYMKSVRLCANMLVKNICTSDMEYQPGLTLDDIKKQGLAKLGLSPFPREMSFPHSKTQDWHQLYDFIKFPSENSKKAYEAVHFGVSGSKSAPVVNRKESVKAVIPGSRRADVKTIHVNKGNPDRVSVMDQMTTSRKQMPRKHVVKELPSVGVEQDGSIITSKDYNDEVHVYANTRDPVMVNSKRSKNQEKIVTCASRSNTKVTIEKESFKSLKPDPILQLKRIVGFGGATYRDALWTSNGTTIVYPCHAVVVAMQVTNGHQRFFIGHTDKVSCISMNGSSSLLASGQTGPQSVVRVWKYSTGECLAMFKTHVHSLHCLSMSHSGSVLSGVGKDNHGKNMVVIWNTEEVDRRGQVSVMAKAHTDVDIHKMRISAFDDTSFGVCWGSHRKVAMVSCGRDNIRLWRVKDGNLRSAPVNLGEYHSMEFTDCCFQVGYEATKDPLDRLVYACSKAGHIFEISYKKVSIQHVRRLLPTVEGKKDKAPGGAGISINSMCVNEAFCATGSDDGFLRLWPLDFKHVYLEAEHEGPVTAVDIAADGVKILAGTSTGNVGILDVATRGYTTVMRSHTSHILSLTLDPIRRHMATVSDDHTIRVWDLDTMQQLYDFSAPKECPCAIAFHPSQQLFACGFESGSVRVFSVANTSMLAEYRQHRGKVTGVAYSPNGNYLYSGGSLGTLALYDATDNQYQLLRVLANTMAHGERYGPESLSTSPDGKYVAFVGPTEFTVSVVNARSLDEVMRIDISSVNPPDGANIAVDAAIRVKYTPASIRQLMVTTSSNRLLKFDAGSGKILTQVDNIHRSGCSSLEASVDGRHLATAGDKAVKIWDYHMRLDLNFQVFIGHSSTISKVCFAPDSVTFISAGEAIFVWDFMANARELPSLEGRTSVKNYFTGEDVEYAPYPTTAGTSILSEVPRNHAPQPMLYEPGNIVADLSNIQRDGHELGLLGDEIVSQTSDQTEDILAAQDKQQSDQESVPENESPLVPPPMLGSPKVKLHHSLTEAGTPKKVKSQPATPSKVTRSNHPQPSVYKHFKQKVRKYQLAQRRYTSPPNQSGLKLKCVMGYNGNGRSNMVWNPDTGLFAYSQGCVVIIEDLQEGTQQHLVGHPEEVSTLALQHDCQVLVSANGAYGLSQSQIIVWDIQTARCKQVLTYHENDIVCLAYSRDDRFLISVGDYRECSIVVWSALDYSILTSTKTTVPIHDLKWDPYTCNEFASVGVNGTLLFWLLDETSSEICLNLHQAEIPADIMSTKKKGISEVDFTCLEYAGDSTLYVGSSTGNVSAWDTRHNTCFMHWQADTQEIDVVVSKSGRLVTGGLNKNLKIWTTSGVGEMRLPGERNEMREGGLTMDDEMNLDGEIVSATFDDTMDMGIVGSSAGTLWYVNWAERSCIRLVSGHSDKVTGIALCDNQYLATCSSDGSVRVWSVADKEQTLQFQVMHQSCNCISFAPHQSQPNNSSLSNHSNTSQQDERVRLPNIVAGYSDGTVRMFDLKKVEMVLKMQPHAVEVTAISFSSDGRMIISGGKDGLVAISSPTTGITVRIINDHKGAPITQIDVTLLQDQEAGISAPQLWLAASADRRVSVWSADWSKDFCELVDWLTFPAPAFTPDGVAIKKGDQSYFDQVPPSLAQFSKEEPDIVVYTGYGMQKQIQFYSLSERKVLRTLTLTHWANTLAMSPTTPLISLGINERLLKLMDYYEGSFQDFTGHGEDVQIVKFSPDGSLVYSVSNNEIFIWQVSL